MKMESKTVLSVLCIAAWALTGCGQPAKVAPSGPVEGTLKLEGLTTEQQIEKVQSDPTIPPQIKETYINSLKAKAGQR